ncbi:hypothetical protein BAUCODRAFT_499052 [Baudoinia panamericana UAMH 10762]|uniref:Transmembrane protein UsgS n=1 Tax=Baudoinia panamericana (strain UAMH 10762) TaxID=717646 RepID=M2MVU0_BAUPA|nr:uncharacterized protein BAUCODRAFT_499052 [Baudoinia panamericana UAMH 10762]EMC95688.1 hypothetical protein BAUCODRAFT_499052 [Baudoinia panamericana UAMH 10762]
MSGNFDPQSFLKELHTSFEINAILRGAQLTFVGANRALQNPALFTSVHYRQAAFAVIAGLLIRLIVAIPTVGIRLLIHFAGFFVDLDHSAWDEDVIEGIEFVEHSVVQVPFFLMSFIRYLSPAMDAMFMDSLAWVDRTYVQKHKDEDPDELRAMYYQNLKRYNAHGENQRRDPYMAIVAFLTRFGKRAALSLAVYLCSFIPYVGRFVLPAVSFYTFNKAVGPAPAVLIFSTGIFLPRRYLVRFLQSYFSSRTLMRELLDPYFSRIRYTPEQKRRWFKEREGVLYGFALTFFIILRIPLGGVLIYGVAEASTAYLITKITSPPPPPEQAAGFRERDVRWENKHEFLSLPLEALDKLNIKARGKEAKPTDAGDVKGRQFT